MPDIVRNDNSALLTINAGSSSIKAAYFAVEKEPNRQLSAQVDRIGLPGAELTLKRVADRDSETHSLGVVNHTEAFDRLLTAMSKHADPATIAGIGHRVVHGGANYSQPEIITASVLEEFQRLRAFAPEHMPAALELIEACRQRFPKIKQIACFDTAFHAQMPEVAKLLPIPREFQSQGVQRYGFHGISYAYLMQELPRFGPPGAAEGRIVLAHLGNGASMAAVRNGKPVDTTMGFTPASGMMMSTRTGDIDPGLIWYLMTWQRMNAEEFYGWVNRRCGLLGISDISSDMRDLLSKEKDDPRAAQAIGLYCYDAKKWIGALTAALGGLDTLVFSGGIGENAPEIRARICDGLDFLHLQLNENKNAANASVISTDASRVTVLVIPTDEEQMIAREVFRLSKSEP